MFDSNFETVLADTAWARHIHYGIRYRIFCLETGFEDPDEFSNSEERDEHDAHAAHFIVHHKENEQWVASMRLVQSLDGALPLQSLCTVDRQTERLIASGSVVEMSRLAVIDHYRRRDREYDTSFSDELTVPASATKPGNVITLHDRRKEPEVLTSIMHAAVHWCRSESVGHILFLITPALARIMTRMRINLQAVGPACTHQGMRYPYLCTLKDTNLQSTRNIAGEPQEAAYTLYSQLAEERRYG